MHLCRVSPTRCGYSESMVTYPSESSLILCQAFLELLSHWNKVHALTSLASSERFEELILDAWVLVPYLDSLKPGERVVDFGTGMGIPAVVLSIARPDLEIIALDKSQKKMAFVRQAGLELKLTSLHSIAARVEGLPPLQAALGTAKAVGAPKLLAEWWGRHGKEGAPFYALKSASWEKEALPDTSWKLISHPYTLPTRGSRVVLEMKKGTP